MTQKGRTGLQPGDVRVSVLIASYPSIRLLQAVIKSDTVLNVLGNAPNQDTRLTATLM